MFSSEVKKLLIEVISSWQILAVTIVLIIYMSIVNYVARIHHRRSRKQTMPKAKKEGKGTPAPHESDELGLEHESE
jgi:hypothetical protein